VDEIEPTNEVYQRRFSTAQRFLKILTSPSEVMKDIAQAPSYDGITVIFFAQVFVFAFGLWLIFQKIQITGQYSNLITGLLSLAVVLAGFFSLVLFVGRWALKSLIVKSLCDSGSSWEFKTAASITSYAYTADIVLGIFGIIVGWFLLPTFHLDTGNLDVSRQLLNDYQTQIMWLKLTYTLPLSLLGLLWKSYLGGLGTHFGTKGRCPLRKGIVVFFCLGLIGVLLLFL
jgi:hypothetical protein